MSLKEKAMQMNTGCALMVDREKGDVAELMDTAYTINDMDILTGEDGEYVVFTVKEDAKKFYFGGSVISDKLMKFSEDEKQEIRKDGLPFTVVEKKSKNKRKYADIVFYPEGI
jgi:hypothetical protein